MPHRRRVAASTAVGILGIALAMTVIGLAGASALRFMQEAVRNAYVAAENRSAAAAAHATQVLTATVYITDNLLDQIPTAGRDAASFREVVAGRPFHELLRSRERSFPAVDAVSIFDADGQMVSTSRQFPASRISIADREAYLIPRQGRRAPHVTTPVRSRSTGEWTFYVARRLESDTGEFLGVLVVGLSAKYFANFYAELSGSTAGREGWRTSEADAIWLIREDGAPLTRSPFDPARMPALMPGINVPVTAQLLGPSTSPLDLLGAAVGGTGRHELLSVRKTDGLPIFAAATIGEDRYRQEWRAAAMNIGLLAALATAALAGTFASIVRMLRRREAEMVANVALREAADSSNRAKSEFLATMSHEIRTPLNGLLGTADLLANTRLDEHQNRLLSTLIGSGRILLGIMDDILDLSKIEARELRLDSRSFSPTKLAQGVKDLFANYAANKGVTLSVEVKARVPQCVVGDGNRIQQILVNLVSNAIKFTDAGNVTIVVDAPSTVGNRSTVRFQVEDTGCGIEPAARDRIFLPFTQADSSVSRRFGGTGLGLAISRRLVHLMGGSIDFRSTVGVGTCFWFDLELPVVECEPTQEPALPPDAHVRFAHSGTAALMPAPDAIHKGRHVLVVEDDSVNSMIAEAQLNQLGCSCVIAFDGEEALAQLAADRFDLVLMDCMLPGMSGYDVTRAWRVKEAQQSLEHVPIIALTANALSSNVEKCRQAGMDDFLTKPCTAEKLAIALKRWLPDRTASTS